MALRRAWLSRRSLAAALALGPVGGCALSYTDQAGIQHVVGFVDVAVRPAEAINLAGSIIDVTALGLSFLAFDNRTSVGLGYQHVTAASFRDNAVAIGPFDHVAFDRGAAKPDMGTAKE